MGGRSVREERPVFAIILAGGKGERLRPLTADRPKSMVPLGGKPILEHQLLWLRDGGVTLWEGGIRVPCIARWPGRLPAGTVCREPLLSCDLFAMAVAAAGGALPSDRTFDGRDPTAALAGKAPSPHGTLYFQFRKQAAMRRGRYKIVRTNPAQEFQLFDLVDDIGETTNVAAAHPDLLEVMKRDFVQWQAAVRWATAPCSLPLPMAMEMWLLLLMLVPAMRRAMKLMQVMESKYLSAPAI